MLDRLSHIETWLSEAEAVMSGLRASMVREHEPARRKAREVRIEELLSDMAEFEAEWVALQQEPPLYAYRQRIRVHRAAGNDEAALQSARRAIAAAGQAQRPLAVLHIECAEILGRLGRWHEARSEYERAGALSGDAGIVLGQALTLFHLDDPNAEVALGGAYHAALAQQNSTVALTALSYQAALAHRGLNEGVRQREEVLELYNQAITLGETAATSDYLALLYLNRANLNRDSGATGERSAEEDYNQAAQRDPLNADVHHERAKLYRNAGQFEQADALFRQAIAIDPDRGDILTNWATLRLRLRDFATALAYYQHALSNGWRDPALFSGLGTCAIALGRFDEAAAYFHQAVEMDASDGTAWGNRAAVAFHQGRLDDARALYQQAVAHDAGPVEAAWNLALTPRHDNQSLRMITLKAAAILASFSMRYKADWYERAEYEGAHSIAQLLAGQRDAVERLARQRDNESDELAHWYWANTARMVEILEAGNEETAFNPSPRSTRR